MIGSFFSKLARDLNIAFQKFGIEITCDDSVLSIVRLHAFMTSVIDSSLNIIHDKRKSTPITSQNNNSWKHALRNEGRIAVHYMILFKSIVPHSTSLLLYDTMYLFQKRVSPEVLSVRKNIFSIKAYWRGPNAKQVLSLYNSFLTFTDFTEGYYYVFSTLAAFSERIRHCIGPVADCDMHYYDSLYNPLKPCSRHINDRVVNDIEDQVIDVFSTSIIRKE